MSYCQAATSTNAFLWPVEPTVPRTSPCFRKKQFPSIFFPDSPTVGPAKERQANSPDEPAESISPDVVSVGKHGGAAVKTWSTVREADASASFVGASVADTGMVKLTMRNPFAFSNKKLTVRRSMGKEGSSQ